MQTLDEVCQSNGTVLFLGPGDRGKTTQVERLARNLAATMPIIVLDLDPGQSAIGPPGMMDMAEANADKPMEHWRARRQWYLGEISPYAAPGATVTAAVRLLDSARALGRHTVLVDTASFIPTPAGHALACSLVDALRPDMVVAVAQEGEMDAWLRGIFTPITRLIPEEAVRVKPQSLRAVRRATRLAGYFQNAPQHSVRLDQWPLRGTRLGLGAPLPAAIRATAATALGCPVVHAERAGRTTAVWTLGPPRHGTAGAAANLNASRIVTYDAAWWKYRSAGLLRPDGSCLAMAFVEQVDWPSLTASIRTPIHSLAEAAVVSLGRFRHQHDGEALPPVPDDMI